MSDPLPNRPRALSSGTEETRPVPFAVSAVVHPASDEARVPTLQSLEGDGPNFGLSRGQERAALSFGQEGVLTTSPSPNYTTPEYSRRNYGRSTSTSSISTDASQPYRALADPTRRDETSEGPYDSQDFRTASRLVPSGSMSGHGDANSSSRPLHRKRGRPPKDPSTAAVKAKREKNRTRTGCITCHKRKKKCTEERPVCSNCQRINYVCEYPEAEVYKTGSEKADEARKSAPAMPRSIPSLFEGIESPMDQRLLGHFIHNCSSILSMNSHGRNLYLVYFVPMAACHGPLMHAVLALSASHLTYQTSLGDQVIEPGLDDHRLALHALAIRGMRRELTGLQGIINEEIIAINLLTILYTVAQGQSNGEYHKHVAAAKTMSGLLNSENEELCDFVYENIRYFATLSTLLSTKGQEHLPIPAPNGISKTPVSQLMGVNCGSLTILGRISQLRVRVRETVRSQAGFVLDSSIYAEAADIDIELHGWETSAPKDSSRWLGANINQRAAWAYLRRTMTFPSPGPETKSVFEDALELFERLPENDSALTCLLYSIFLLGCCAFEEGQRARIRSALDRILAYTGMRNVQVTKEFTERLWDRMDHDVHASWDWEGLAEDLNMDLLIT